MLTWYDNCVENHERCKVTQLGPLYYPTRLLDIGDEHDSGVELIITATSNLEGSYLTLSHRWGDGHMYTLTMAELRNFQAGIPLANLPRIFRDAVKIARHLRVRDLWIDSLCIIQDSLTLCLMVLDFKPPG